VGTLNKWVNGIKGYHERFFVLDHNTGVLAYYKTRGERKYKLPIDSSQPGTKTIGDVALKLELKIKQGVSKKKIWLSEPPKSQGEVRGHIFSSLYPIISNQNMPL
jgi:hypothetical protein